MRSGMGIHAALIPGTFRTVANKENDYLIDRVAQQEKRTFSGVLGFGQQDSAIQESMGAIQDRSLEHLGTSDIGILVARRRMFEAATAVRDGGVAPGRDAEQLRVRAASLLLPKGIPFSDGLGGALVADPERAVVTL